MMSLPCKVLQQPLGTILPLDEVKRLAIISALDRCKGNYQLAARLLCVGRTTLYRLAREYNYQAVTVQGEALMTLPPRRTLQHGHPPRQRTSSQIVELLLQGCDNPEIARQLNIACRTVKAHFNRLFRRFGITSGIKRVKLATLLYRRQTCPQMISMEHGSPVSVNSESSILSHKA
jgi:ATP/maltotriose-dependent transcriptional regulator MalT